MASESLIDDDDHTKEKASCIDTVRCLFCGLCKKVKRKNTNDKELEDLNKNVDKNESRTISSVPTDKTELLKDEEQVGQTLDKSKQIDNENERNSRIAVEDKIKLLEEDNKHSASLDKSGPNKDIQEIKENEGKAKLETDFADNTCSPILHSTSDKIFDKKNSNGSITLTTSSKRITPEGSENTSEIVLTESPVDILSPDEDHSTTKDLTSMENDTKYFSLSSQPLLYTQSDLDEVVRAREVDWKKKYEELESKIKEEIAMRELLEQDHREKMECSRKENDDMKQVLAQYEKTIVDLTENTNHNSEYNEEILSETVRAKDQLQQDLQSAEQNLVDAYKRIEKLRHAIDTYKQNEDELKKSNSEFQLKLKKSEERYQKLKQHASDKIDAANIEINKVRKQKEIDLAGLQAGLKKATSRINSLEQELEQKTRESAEFAQICDELIKKVSGE